MPGSGSSSLSIVEALGIAKANHDTPASVTQKLERANTETWQKIQANPTTYLMTMDEYSVLNYFQERYQNNRQYEQAMARFWKHYNHNGSNTNGAG